MIEVCDYPKVDFGSTASIQNCIRKALPDCIINAAAYTAVDKAEQEEGLAYKINHEAVAVLAEFAREKGIRLVHFHGFCVQRPAV